MAARALLVNDEEGMHRQSPSGWAGEKTLCNVDKDSPISWCWI
jgi:hypothetical protein